MKQIIIVIYILIFNNCFSQKEQNLSNIDNVEIYLFKNYCLNENSYIYYTQEQKNKLYNQYSTTDYFPIIFCKNYINIDLCDMEDKPFLELEDISNFNWETKTLTLSDSGIIKLNTLYFNRHGIPFVITIKNQPYISAWFWGKGESEACDRVFCELYSNNNKLKLRFGNGKYRCGKDPLTNSETLTKLKQLIKL